jgi:hypothetical protein
MVELIHALAVIVARLEREAEERRQLEPPQRPPHAYKEGNANSGRYLRSHQPGEPRRLQPGRPGAALPAARRSAGLDRGASVCRRWRQRSALGSPGIATDAERACAAGYRRCAGL